VGNDALRILLKALLALRYRIRVRGLRQVRARGRRGILFLPNHPALIDPIILVTYLQKDFRACPLAEPGPIDRFFIRWLARRSGVIPIPALSTEGTGVRRQVRRAIDACAGALRAGQNVIVYPAGRLQRHRFERLGANSGVERILRAAPGARVVLVRTTGLWGSGFSRARGGEPDIARVLRRGLAHLAASGVVFAPRREVTVTFHEPHDLPRRGLRAALNRAIEQFHNADAPPATYVPYSLWEPSGRRALPDPPGAA
jgi:long-chain-fatty-acid--[acyl-carrier-protein] ligase